MSIATMQEEIVGVSVRLNQAIRPAAISKTSSFIAFLISRGLGRYFKTGLSFVVAVDWYQ